jgi:sugar fermentation stimulation protein A
MTYSNIREGIFKSRPNRFIAHVEIDGKLEICHVKNTGRCMELLIPDVAVFLNESNNPNRTTKYDLIAVRKGERLINIDSQAPNKVFMEHLQSGAYTPDITRIKPEAKYGNSRFDFFVETGERKLFIEVKGVTLEENGVALFPDAPTERGVKHLQELTRCLADGYEAHAVFVIQMSEVDYFTPNRKLHPAFATALSAAESAGVKISAFNCIVTCDSLSIGNPVLARVNM